MPAEALNVSLPGASPMDLEDENTAHDPHAAALAEKDQIIAQQAAMLSELQEKVRLHETVPSAQPKMPGAAPRLVGEDWGNKTSAEAAAAGVMHTVKCIDGYYVPPTRV